MSLVIVGSGTAAPQPDRVCAGHLLESADLHLLLTHVHNNHIG